MAAIVVALLLDLVSCWNYLFVPRYGRAVPTLQHISRRRDSANLAHRFDALLLQPARRRPVHPPAAAAASETAQAISTKPSLGATSSGTSVPAAGDRPASHLG
jgi:hypothetical protein